MCETRYLSIRKGAQVDCCFFFVHLNIARLIQMLSGGKAQEQRLKGIHERILQRNIPIEEVLRFPRLAMLRQGLQPHATLCLTMLHRGRTSAAPKTSQQPNFLPASATRQQHCQCRAPVCGPYRTASLPLA